VSFMNSRLLAGKRIADVAKALNVSPSAVCQWESGETMPRADKLKQIAEMYGCTVDDLLKDENTKK